MLMVQTKIFDQYKRRNEYHGIRPASITGSILIEACMHYEWFWPRFKT